MNRVQQFLSVALFVVAASQIAIGVVSFTSGAATGNPLINPLTSDSAESSPLLPKLTLNWVESRLILARCHLASSGSANGAAAMRSPFKSHLRCAAEPAACGRTPG